MPHFIKIEVGETLKLVRWIDLEQVCYLTADHNSEGLIKTVKIVFTGGGEIAIPHGEGQARF
jgi:hypothetical protein